MKQKLDYKKTFLIGFGFFSTSVMWAIYNTYVPIYLQAGSPGFEAATFGFGLSATLTGFIMTLDNIAAFFLQPLTGALSDRTYTRFGRRMPYITGFAPIAVLGFFLIPVAPEMIPARYSGQVGELTGLFPLAAGKRPPVALFFLLLCPFNPASRLHRIQSLTSSLAQLIPLRTMGIASFAFSSPMPFVRSCARTAYQLESPMNHRQILSRSARSSQPCRL